MTGASFPIGRSRRRRNPQRRGFPAFPKAWRVLGTFDARRARNTPESLVNHLLNYPNVQQTINPPVGPRRYDGNKSRPLEFPRFGFLDHNRFEGASNGIFTAEHPMIYPHRILAPNRNRRCFSFLDLVDPSRNQVIANCKRSHRAAQFRGS